MKLSEVLNNLLSMTGLSQYDLAKELQCSQSSISRMLCDKQIPTIHMLHKIILFGNKYNLKLNFEDLIKNEK